MADLTLLRAQELLLQLYQEGAGIETGLARWSSTEFFDDLWVLCAAVIFAGPPSLAAGLGQEIEKAWREHCATRGQSLMERKGRKGSNDHPFSKVPAPRLLAVAVRTVLPVLLAESEKEQQRGVKELLGFVSKRSLKAVQRVRNFEPMSQHLRLALVEASIVENQVLAYLRNHPAKGMRRDFRHYDEMITPEFIESELREIVQDVDAEEFVGPFRVMVRFVISRTAKFWADVCCREDPEAISSQITRLVNEAGKAGVSRKLARLVVEVATLEPEYPIVTYLTKNADGHEVVWYERESRYYERKLNLARPRGRWPK